MRVSNTKIWMTAAIALLLSTAAPAALLVSHEGANDPLTEGWSHTGSWGWSNVSVGSVYNDQGYDAWSVDDNYASSGTARGYLYNIGSEDIAAGKSQGWQLDFTLRSVDNPDAMDLAVAMEVGDDDKRWGTGIRLDGAGNTEMWLWTDVQSGPTVTIAGEGYHDYRFIYDPLSTFVDVIVDDVLVYDDWVGSTDAGTQRVVWGSNESAATGQGNWASVDFQILEGGAAAAPISGSFLLLMGSLPLLRRRTS